MKVLVVADGHYYIDENSIVYADSVYGYDFFKRYIEAFGEVTAACRMIQINSGAAHNLKVCSGPSISFLPLTAFHGPFEYAKNYFRINNEARRIVKEFDKAIFRVPGAVPNVLLKKYRKLGCPYALEVVVDPWKFFAPGTSVSFSRPFVRVSWTVFLKYACKTAAAVSYVTKEYLQKKYPANKKALTSYYSSVEIRDDSIAKQKQFHDQDKQVVISHVCNGFASYGKGHVPLIRALKAVRDSGYDAKVIFVGDGPLRGEFEELADSLGLSEYVLFIGMLPSGEEVRSIIRDSDLFVFPTKAEGLPRVILEAMAEGIPCISTPVCGIPEILDSDYLVSYDDYYALAEKIIWLSSDKTRWEQASARNIEIAHQYSDIVLNERRKVFYQSFAKMR